MKLLITGAFGNIGQAILREACRRGHEVTVFEKDSPLVRKLARKYRKTIREVLFGDIRDTKAVSQAVSGMDGVIHLSGIIPPFSESNPQRCYEVNVDGTRNVAKAILEDGNRASLVFASSVTVTGHTQHLPPPVKACDPYSPMNHYNKSKIQAEMFLKEAGLSSYCITRLGAVMPTIARYRLRSMKFGYEIPYHSRVEIVTDRDVATAQINAVEKLFRRELPSGNIYLLGGGETCRMTYGEFIGGFFRALGMKAPEKSLFTKKESILDWMDTGLSQSDLLFQHDSIQDFYCSLRRQYRVFLPLIRLFRSVAYHLLVSKSAYYKYGRMRINAKSRLYHTR